MINFLNGNILNSKCNIICQSVNHQGVMGSGLAKQIRDKYPDIVNGYENMCRTHTFRSIMRNGLVHFHSVFDNKGVFQQIASIFGQEKYGKNKRHTNYTSLMNGFIRVFEYAESQGYSIAIPYGIGCGLGGGDWETVLLLLKDVLEYYPTLNIYIYKM